MRLSIFIFVVAFLSACHEEPVHYNGYIDADMTYLSSNYPGRLAALAVYRGQTVQQKQLLFQIDQTDNHLDIEMSRLTQKNLLAQRQELLNQIHYDELNYRRIATMRQSDAASQNDLELARTDLQVLKHKLEALDFQIKSSEVNTAEKEWEQRQKENHALNDGIIYDTYFNPGEYVQAGQPIASLITKDKIKVLFYVPESALSRIKLNDLIRVSSDGAPRLVQGVISYISNTAQYTPPIIYSREERSALVFRVEARIVSPDLAQIHLGQPVTVEFIS